MRVRKAMHKWTTHDRELLCLLKIRYRRKFIRPIFNHMLNSRLKKEGFQTGVTAPSLDAQYAEMKTGSGSHEIYVRIINLPEPDVERTYQSILNRIEATIRTLKLKTQPSQRITKSLTKARQKKPLKQKLRRTNRVPESDISDASPEPEPLPNLVRPRLQQFAHHNHRSPYFAPCEPTNVDNSDHAITLDNDDAIPPTPRINTDIDGNPALTRPLLLFRSTEKVDVLRSRRYEDANKSVPPPPKFKSKEYRQHAWPHLERDKEYASPFISFGQSALDVIGRLETARSEDRDTKKFLAVYAFNDIEADAAQNFGTGSGPHLVRGLFSKDELSDLPKGYRGGGEWLVWGSITCEPLVVLDSAQAIRLAKAIRKFKTGDIAALVDVSKSLEDVPAKWKEAVAYVILNSFCKSKLPKVGTPAYKELMEIIINGRRVASMAESIDLSRLSVHDDLSDDEDDDTEEISPPPQCLERNQDDHRTIQPVQNAAPTGPVGTSTDRVTSVFGNRSYLASRSALGGIPPNTYEATPFWSPDPESIIAEAEKSQSTQNYAQASATQKVVNLEVDDEEEDWELINADLEKSFAKSFPSASKRICNFKPANYPQSDSDIDIDNEDEDHIIPSIEKDYSYNKENSYNRGNFLRGLTQFATSMSPPLIETPSKMPLDPAPSVILQPYDVNTISGTGRPQSAMRTPRFQPYQALTKRTQNPASERPELGKVTSRNDRGGNGTSANTSTGASNSNPWPETNVRTKVPVIVRKQIVDY